MLKYNILIIHFLSKTTVKNVDKNKKRLQMPRGKQKPYIEEGQTTQWPQEEGQKDKKGLKIPKR